MKRMQLRELSHGFTIVELMIATVIFSMVLIIITAGVLSFTHDYYKGVNSSATQNTAQAAMDAISQAVQFSAKGTSPGTLPAPTGVFCAGTKLFLYNLGVQYNGAAISLSNTATWGLYMVTNPSATCAVSSLTSLSATARQAVLDNGTQLLGTSMRLTDVTLSQVSAGSTTWNVSLQVAFGDSDLLCNHDKSGTTGGCQPGNPSYAISAAVSKNAASPTDGVYCKPTTGSQFCSIASLSAVAGQRIQ